MKTITIFFSILISLFSNQTFAMDYPTMDYLTIGVFSPDSDLAVTDLRVNDKSAPAQCSAVHKRNRCDIKINSDEDRVSFLIKRTKENSNVIGSGGVVTVIRTNKGGFSAKYSGALRCSILPGSFRTVNVVGVNDEKKGEGRCSD